MHLIVYDTAEENVFLVSGTLRRIDILMGHLAVFHSVREFADNMKEVFLEAIPSPGCLT